MTQFLGGPKVQYFDNNGDPLSGGKLYTYEPGTTTNKASYPTIADALAGTNANANPVVLDSRGEADVVLAGKTKLKLDDSADNTIWTLDNVNGDPTIVDTNGNEEIVFTSTASAVNYFRIVNAATGNNPQLRCEGEADTGITFANSEGEEILILDSVASSVNEITIKSSATGVNPIISCTGEADTGVTVTNADGEEIVILDSIATSVNEFTLKSAATGTGPTLAATGDDTNIDINIIPKGTGVVNVGSSATAAGEVRLFEDTDNGTNYMGFKAPTAVTTSLSFQLPDGDGSANNYLITNGSGTLSWSAGLSQATQAALEAETNEDTYVAPDLIKYSPGVAKAWLNVDGTGTPAINVSHNITSITDNATGILLITIATDFSGINYVAAGMAQREVTSSDAFVSIERADVTNPTATTLIVHCFDAGAVNRDPKRWCVVMFGDQ